jgi:hypothetical protein
MKRKGGGVCIYIRSEFDSRIANINIKDADVSDLIEIIWVTFTYNNSTTEHYVGCCYYPPKPIYDVLDFKNIITCHIEYIFNNSSDSVILLAGDFNRLNTEFIENELGLKQIVNTPTHCANMLDKVFVNIPDLFNVSVVKSLIKTKHSALLISTNPDNMQPCPEKKRTKVLLYD